MEKILALIVGLCAGALATASHQAMWFNSIPIGLILGFVLLISTLVWWSESTKATSSSVILAISMVISLLAMLFVVHNSLIVPANWQGYVWVYGMPFVVFFTLLCCLRNRSLKVDQNVYPNPLKGLK